MQPKPATNGSNLLALPDGHELVGDYRITRVLGAGGFGITYLAEEAALARLVTIKEYFPADYAARQGEIEASPRSRDCEGDYKWGLDRFIEEAQTLAKFTHPNIVQVFRYFRANSTGYMVLKFEEGGSFKAWLKALKRAPRQAELDAILTPLLDALEFVHKGQFLHRDIAPDNIIIRKDGAPVLIDFGSARGDIAAHSKTVSALVKPGYSPYEQYSTDARQQGPWTDIYALGGTLYHAISGKRPPDAPTRIVSDEYVPAREAALSSYRPGFLDAIDKALRLDITARPQSIAEWRGMLLAPPPKRGQAEARGILGFKSDAKRARAEKPAAAPAAAPASAGLVPAPPDAPQPKGQLLDFIEGLKKHRPQAAKAARSPAPAEKADAADVPPPKAPAKQADAPRTRLPKVLQKRTEKRAPKPRRMPALGSSTRWRSLATKLMIGIAIASIAVYVQDPQPTPQPAPQVQGRGQAVLASQTGDIAQLGQLTGHKASVQSIAVLDQGKTIVTASADGTLKVWNAAASSLQRTIELDDGPATALGVFASDKRVLTGHKSGTIVLWDIEKAEKLAQFQHGELAVTGLAPLVDGNRFTAINAGGAIAVFDVRTPSSAPVAVEQTGSAPLSAQLLSAARSRASIAFVSPDRMLRLWQLDQARGRSDGGRLVRSWRLPEAATTAIDTASHGWATATGDADGNVRLWNTANARGARSAKLHEGRVAAIAFGPGDRTIASAGEDGIVRLWDTWSGGAPRTLRIGVGPLKSLAFSGDGRRLYVAGGDGGVRIWSAVPVALSGN